MQNFSRGLVASLLIAFLAACANGPSAPAEAPNAKFIDESQVTTTAVTEATEAMLEQTNAPAEEFAVCFYDDSDYRGSGLCIPKTLIGDSPRVYPYVGDAGNDKTSSIRIAPGYRIEAYYDIDYGGGGWIMRSDISFLGQLVDPSGVDFNDKISSVKVIKE